MLTKRGTLPSRLFLQHFAHCKKLVALAKLPTKETKDKLLHCSPQLSPGLSHALQVNQA